MPDKKNSAAFDNMVNFWINGGHEISEYYQKLLKKKKVGPYISRGSDIEGINQISAEELLIQQLKDCHYIIMTANRIESQTMKRLLYEEARYRRIYKYWNAMEKGEISDKWIDPKDSWDDTESIVATPDESETESSARSPKLLEINLQKEVQYYFVTLGATEQEMARDITNRSIKVCYICPSSTSSFSGNGSHKAVVHALRRFSDNKIGYPFVASLGVAFGLHPAISESYPLGNQKLGDVLISQNIIAYDSKYKAEEEEGISFQNCEKYSLEIGASRAFAGLINDWEITPFAPQNEKSTEYNIDYKLNMDKVRCHLGSLFSGGAVVSSASFKEKLLASVLDGNKQPTTTLHPIGGEMEGVGIWYACLLEDDLIPCIVIKGICDWGEEKNGWATLLGKKEPDYLKEKLLEVLPNTLREKHQYDRGFVVNRISSALRYHDEDSASKGFIDKIVEACGLEKNDRTQKLEMIIDELDESERESRDDLLKKFEAICESVNRAANDLIKDSIQAYATEQAFKTFCYMLYKDPQLGKIPAQSPNESKKEKEYKELKTLPEKLNEKELMITELNKKMQELEFELKNAKDSKQHDEKTNELRDLLAKYISLIEKNNHDENNLNPDI